MVTITNCGPMSQVLQVRDGAGIASKSLGPGASDDFDIAPEGQDFADLLARCGVITIAKPAVATTPAPPPAPQPAPVIPLTKPAVGGAD